MKTAVEEILLQINFQHGGWLASNYEYPGRYNKWARGFVNPPIKVVTHDNFFTLTALNSRGMTLLPYLAECLYKQSHLEEVNWEENRIVGSVKTTEHFFPEEKRSKQPSVFSVIREILSAFKNSDDNYLGLYGTFGYDLIFQLEPMPKRLERSTEQRDLVLYLPDELVIVDYYSQRAFRLQYEFETKHGNTKGLPRSGEIIDHKGKHRTLTQHSDHQFREYENQVQKALDYFRQGELFEVVPSQSFFQSYDKYPHKLFQRLQEINPSPYGFIFNLGGEYLVGASPEIFVRVEGRRVETCPISGTIKRGKNAIEDATQILQLLNSRKDEAELTMCTDVDRNDKSRICIPGSVQVIGRRQIEVYSHLIHTVDHVEGILRPEYDALDAFLTHLWAVTVTGAPKRAAMQFLEQHERTPRRWYGGAVGYITFNGNLNTGLILRTIQLKDTIAEVRVGATVHYDSNPKAEAEETLTKAAALFQTLHQVNQTNTSSLSHSNFDHHQAGSEFGKRVLLIDNEDSFVHTLANYIRQTDATVETLRHGFSESVFDEECPDLVVISPGPGRPNDFCLGKTIKACINRQIPIFGVCLGFQAIIEAFGGKLGILDYPQHGKVSRISVNTESTLFKGLPDSFEVGRYHSLFAMPENMPQELNVTALSEDGVIMAVEHCKLPIAGVQFHPESIMSLAGGVGLAIIQNVLHKYTRSKSPQLSSYR